MPENPDRTLLFGPSAIAVHDHSDVSGEFIQIYMFLIRSHKGAKVVKDLICCVAIDPAKPYYPIYRDLSGRE
jgi:hypothetical protein